jgi:hypothetical protein
MAAASVLAAEPGTVLKHLGARLKQARSLPVGSKTGFTCPENLDQFKGVAMATVFSALTKPDYENDNEHTYFLTSPVPPGQRGGGFPELTFVETKSGIVERATCHYAR